MKRASRTCETSVWQSPAARMRTPHLARPRRLDGQLLEPRPLPEPVEDEPAGLNAAAALSTERVGAGADPLEILGRRPGDALLDELLAALEHGRPRLGVLPARLEQRPQPAATVLGVQRLVGPVELHVDFARRVAHLVERSGALALAADVLRLEVAEHPEAVERILVLPGLVDVAAERDLGRLEAPAGEPFPAHQHVARLVVEPARGLVRELPAELGRQLVEDPPGRLDRPDLVQVADRRAQLERDALAVRVGRVEHVRPVDRRGEVRRVACRVVGRKLQAGQAPRSGAPCRGGPPRRAAEKARRRARPRAAR